MPRKWSIICWLHLLLWVAFGLFANLPVAVPILPQDLSDQMPRRYAAYDPELSIGWPMKYLETKLSGKFTRTISYLPLMLNFLFIVATAISIPIFHNRFMRQFSIKMMLLLTALIASILGLAILGLAIFTPAFQSPNLVGLAIVVIFISPLAFVLIDLAWRLLSKSNKNAG